MAISSAQLHAAQARRAGTTTSAPAPAAAIRTGAAPRRAAPGYIDQHLIPGEHLVMRAHLHCILFLWPATLTALAILLGLGLIVLGGLIGDFGGDLFAGIGMMVVVLLPTSLAALAAYIVYTTSEIGLTDKRVLIKVGWLRRCSLETRLAKIETIHIDQSLLGRWLGYGTLVISGTGGTPEAFPKIADPFAFWKAIQQQIDLTGAR